MTCHACHVHRCTLSVPAFRNLERESAKGSPVNILIGATYHVVKMHYLM